MLPCALISCESSCGASPHRPSLAPAPALPPVRAAAPAPAPAPALRTHAGFGMLQLVPQTPGHPSQPCFTQVTRQHTQMSHVSGRSIAQRMQCCGQACISKPSLLSQQRSTASWAAVTLSMSHLPSSYICSTFAGSHPPAPSFRVLDTEVTRAPRAIFKCAHRCLQTLGILPVLSRPLP